MDTEKYSTAGDVAAFQGPSVSLQPELNHHQDPLLFCAKLRATFIVASSGVLQLEQDTHSAAGIGQVYETRARRLHGVQAQHPSNVATATLSQHAPVSVFKVNGGQFLVSFESYTATDAMRLFVEEAYRSGRAAQQAQHALDTITLKPKEAWLRGQNRLLQVYRAATVDPNRPYLCEEQYFWAVISPNDRRGLMDRAVAVCCPVVADQSLYRAHLMTMVESNNALCNTTPSTSTLWARRRCSSGDS